MATRRHFLISTAQMLAAGGLLALPTSGPAGRSLAAAAPRETERRLSRADEPGGFETLLASIPDSPDSRRGVSLNDLDRVRTLVGAAPLAADADESAAMAYALALSEVGLADSPFVSGLDSYAPVSWGHRAARGFHLGLVSHTALTGTPPDTLELILGHFDPAATEQALGTCSDCPPFQRLELQGLPYFAWGADGELALDRALRPPLFDAYGRGGRLFVSADQIVRTVGTPRMVAALEARLGQRPTLADVPGYQALTSGLTGLGAHSLLLTQDVSSQQTGNGAVGELVSSSAPASAGASADPSPPLLRPYEQLALGNGRDAAGLFMAVSLLHATEQQAAENAERLPRRVELASSGRLQRPWRELLGPVEVNTLGKVLLARLRLREPRPTPWLSWWYARDSLLAFQ